MSPLQNFLFSEMLYILLCATSVHNDTIVLILAGQADCEQTREGENSVLMPSASYIGASGNEENSVTHNRTIHVDGSDQRCH